MENALPVVTGLAIGATAAYFSYPLYRQLSDNSHSISWHARAYMKNVEQTHATLKKYGCENQVSYPSSTFQALLYFNYGCQYPEILMIQNVLSTYIPRLNNLLLQQGKEAVGENLSGKDVFEPITWDTIPFNEWLGIKTDLNRVVGAIEQNSQNLMLIPSPIQKITSKGNFLDYGEIFDDQMNQRATRSVSLASEKSNSSPRTDGSDSLSETASLVSDREYIIEKSEFNPLSWEALCVSQKHVWPQEKSDIFSSWRAFHGMLIIDLNSFCEGLIDAAIDQLTKTAESQNRHFGELVIGYYTQDSNNAECPKKVEILETMLRQKVAQEIPISHQSTGFFRASQHSLPPEAQNVTVLDLNQEIQELRATFASVQKQRPASDLHLFLRPEQRPWCEKISEIFPDLHIQASVIERSELEGHHPEHWLEALSQFVRMPQSIERGYRQALTFSSARGEQELRNPLRPTAV